MAHGRRDTIAKRDSFPAGADKNAARPAAEPKAASAPGSHVHLAAFNAARVLHLSPLDEAGKNDSQRVAQRYHDVAPTLPEDQRTLAEQGAAAAEALGAAVQ